MSNESWERQPQARRRRGVRIVSRFAALDTLGTGSSTTVVDRSKYYPEFADDAVSQRVSVATEAIYRGPAVT
jgi:hypothetical protein